MLAISICATAGYTHAMELQARRVQQCIALARIEAPGHVILSGDDSAELKAIAKWYAGLLPEGWKTHHVVSVKADAAAERPHKDRDDQSEELKRRAFRRIADMREAAHACALKLSVDLCWSLDSDVLPPANALRSSLDCLRFDGGYYGVAFCPYPNLAWLGGFGTPAHPIERDFLPHERRLPARLRQCWTACESRLQATPNAKEGRRRTRLEQRAMKYPPDGNIWEVIAKHGYRRRGWLDQAYPGIGLGAMVPVDWCGFGCTLMGRDALVLADFAGYQGHGTEDLWVGWKRWHPAGIRIAVLPHCPCDHVYWERSGGKSEKVYLRAYHEAAGECRGHLRFERSARPN